MLLNIYVKKADYTYEIDTSLLPRVSHEYAVEYGYRQCLVDPTAGIKRTDFNSDEEFQAAAREVADKRMAQLESGDVPGSRTQKKKADPKIAAVMRKLEENPALFAWIEQQVAAGLPV